MTVLDQPTIDVRTLVARLGDAGAALRDQQILAPLLPHGRIRTRLEGLIYEFEPIGSFSGWGRFRPLDDHRAELVGEAAPWARAAYLELFPALSVLLLWPDPTVPGDWWALPFDQDRAGQQLGLAAHTPLLVHLCDPTDGADSFARAIARVDGQTLWFDAPDLQAGPARAEWLCEAALQPDAPERLKDELTEAERLGLLYWQTYAVADPLRPAGDRRLYGRLHHRLRERLQRAAGRDHLEHELRRALAKADALLHGVTLVPGRNGAPEQIIVQWSRGAGLRRHHTAIASGMTVVSSGVCLSGRDREFDLTSLVSVIAASPWS